MSQKDHIKLRAILSVQHMYSHLIFMVILWNYYCYFRDEETGWKRLISNFPKNPMAENGAVRILTKVLWLESLFFASLYPCLKAYWGHIRNIVAVYTWNVKYLEKIIYKFLGSYFFSDLVTMYVLYDFVLICTFLLIFPPR